MGKRMAYLFWANIGLAVVSAILVLIGAIGVSIDGSDSMVRAMLHGGIFALLTTTGIAIMVLACDVLLARCTKAKAANIDLKSPIAIALTVEQTVPLKVSPASGLPLIDQNAAHEDTEAPVGPLQAPRTP